MSNDKKIKYIKIHDEVSSPERPSSGKKKHKKKGGLTVGGRVGKVLAVIGTTLLSMFLVIIITVCIVATILTVYVMQFAENSFDIDLRDVELSFTSVVYAYDKDEQPVALKQLNTDENRVWVDINDLPDYVLNAFVATEDKRFFEHDGVDWTRTLSVSVSALFSGGTDGGSTITQQLVRNVTGDNSVNVGRKLREIFRALSLEQKYTKIDILESYLNRISFGGTSYGIGSASRNYFDKEAKDLTIAEAAILAGIVRSPSNYNPYASLPKARERQMYVLQECMYAQGLISTGEYEAAVAEQVKFRRPVLGDDFGYIDERYNEYYGILDENTQIDEDPYYENVDWSDLKNETAYKWNGDYETSQSWYTDAAINQVITHLAELKGISETAARELLYSGGYSIYLNVDLEMDEKLSKLFEDPLTVLYEYDPTLTTEDCLQASFVVMDYRGSVKAVVGGLGEKPGDNCFNRATQSERAIGSTIKPIATYSTALERNLITYSTMIRDVSGEIDKVPEEPEPGETTTTTTTEANTTITDPLTGAQIRPDTRVRWPQNYQKNDNGSGNYYPAWYAVQESMNTIAARVLNMVGVKNAFSQLSDRLGFTTLDGINDMSWSPMATGSLTNGAKLYELAAAFQVMGNGGVYYEPYFYSKVVDSAGKTVLEQNNLGIQAISKDTSWITNRMMYTVTHNAAGTGQYAQLTDENGKETIEVVGKTGTSNDMSNLLFMGLTPEYVGAYRIGFDDNRQIEKTDNWITLARVWNAAMSAMLDTSVEQHFTPDSSVIEVKYCTETGLIATSKCPSTAIGYYRESNLPSSCDSKHDGTYWELHADNTIPYYGVIR